MNRYLQSTRYINSTHPQIVQLSKEIVANAAAQRTCSIEKLENRFKAIAIHDYVRDEIKFGFASSFYDQTATDVLTSKVGFCNTKGTLFQALLRAAGIPCRPKFTSIDANILHGAVSPGTSYVDHMITEVYLHEKWVQTDSYIVDSALFTYAKKQLSEENRFLGYGIHIQGQSTWNGIDDSFAQFIHDTTTLPLSHKPITALQDGYFYPTEYEDIGAFYEKEAGVWNKLTWFTRYIVFPLVSISTNASLEHFRSDAA